MSDHRVTFKADVDPSIGGCTWIPATNFLTAPGDPQKDRRITLVGFAVFWKPYSLLGQDGDRLTPVVDFELVPEQHRNVNEMGKGVGPRFYNTPEGVATMRSYKPTYPLGAFLLRLPPEHLLDWRTHQPSSRVGKVLEQTGKHIVAKLFSSPRSVVAKVHREYGDAAAVVLDTPPQPLTRLAVHGLELPPGLTSSFIIVRDPRRVDISQVGLAELTS